MRVQNETAKKLKASIRVGIREFPHGKNTAKNTAQNTVKHTKIADIRPIVGEKTIENTPLCWKKHITVLKTQQNTVKHTSMRKLSIEIFSPKNVAADAATHVVL